MVSPTTHNPKYDDKFVRLQPSSNGISIYWVCHSTFNIFEWVFEAIFWSINNVKAQWINSVYSGGYPQNSDNLLLKCHPFFSKQPRVEQNPGLTATTLLRCRMQRATCESSAVCDPWVRRRAALLHHPWPKRKFQGQQQESLGICTGNHYGWREHLPVKPRFLFLAPHIYGCPVNFETNSGEHPEKNTPSCCISEGENTIGLGWLERH